LLRPKGSVELFVAALRRSLIWGGALILGLGALAAYRYQDAARPWIEANLPAWMGGAPRANFIIVSGNIEAHESVVSFKTVQSRIVELPFDEGAQMKAGTLLARVDDSDYKQQVAIAQATLDAQMRQLDVAEQDVEATRKTVISDEADVALKQLESDRAQTLLAKGAGTVDARDVAETALKQSRAALERDKALEASADKRIALAIANIDTARASLEMARIVLGYTTLKAPFDGVILVRQAELGEVVSPGAAIVTLADIDHVWLRAYVNEPDVGKIRLGEAATVTTDSYPGKEYPGRISFISEAAEFTPKSVETHAERVTLVYRIRIDIDNPSHELVPGLPADARIPVRAPGQP
jgi:HlyD family secretion protein